MRNHLLRLIPLIIMLLITIAIGMGLFESEKVKAPQTQVLGLSAAYFEVPVLGNPDPKVLFSPKSWKNNIVLLSVFASWCEPCIAEHATIMKLAQSGKVAIMGLAWKDAPEKAIEFIRAHGNPYQIIGVDQQGKSTIALALSGVPETFLFDHNGRIVYNSKMPLTDEEINGKLIPLINKLRQEANAPAAR